MSTQTTAADAARQELGSRFSGRLVGPEDSGYDEARAVYNAMIDRRPALIAYCQNTADVAATIAFAREHDLLLAVRGGGHNGGGLGVVRRRRRPRPLRPELGRGRPAEPHRARRRRLHLGPGRRGDPRARSRDSLRGSSRRPASAGSRSAAGSAT